MENKPDPAPSHLLIFPFPAQGHINYMLKLAELLAFSGLNVTFLNSEYNHERLVRYTDIEARFSQQPGFHLRSISYGLLFLEIGARNFYCHELLNKYINFFKINYSFVYINF